MTGGASNVGAICAAGTLALARLLLGVGVERRIVEEKGVIVWGRVRTSLAPMG